MRLRRERIALVARSTLQYVAKNGVAAIEGYVGLTVNLVSGFFVYFWLAPIDHGNIYASLSFNVYVSTIATVTAFSFQARAIEESAAYHSVGAAKRALKLLGRYESLSVLFALVSLTTALMLGVLWSLAVTDTRIFVLAILVLGNCIAATNGSRHALLFSTGEALRVARLQRVHAIVRLALLVVLFRVFGPSAMAVAVASVGGAMAAGFGYRSSVRFRFNRGQFCWRWIRCCLNGWSKVFQPRMIGSLLTRNIDSLQGACEQLALQAIDPTLRVSYSLMIPFMSLVKQGSYTCCTQIESKYAACITSEGTGQSDEGKQLVWIGRAVGVLIVVIACLVLAFLGMSNLLPGQIVKALGPRTEQLWAVPMALVMFPFCLGQAWVFLYSGKAHLYVALYVVSLLISTALWMVGGMILPRLEGSGFVGPIGFVLGNSIVHYFAIELYLRARND
jgi:hypothetical protein